MVKNAQFVINDRTKCDDIHKVNKENYKNYFNTTDLDQGTLGKNICYKLSLPII